MTNTLYLMSCRRKPIRISGPVFRQDPQATLPAAWCSVCGREIFDHEDICPLCRKETTESWN